MVDEVLSGNLNFYDFPFPSKAIFRNNPDAWLEDPALNEETEPVLEYYPTDKITLIDAARSQIRVLNEIVDVLVPLKEMIDHHHDK